MVPTMPEQRRAHCTLVCFDSQALHPGNLLSRKVEEKVHKPWHAWPYGARLHQLAHSLLHNGCHIRLHFGRVSPNGMRPICAGSESQPWTACRPNSIPWPLKRKYCVREFSPEQIEIEYFHILHMLFLLLPPWTGCSFPQNDSKEHELCSDFVFVFRSCPCLRLRAQC